MSRMTRLLPPVTLELDRHEYTEGDLMKLKVMEYLTMKRAFVVADTPPDTVWRQEGDDSGHVWYHATAGRGAHVIVVTMTRMGDGATTSATIDYTSQPRT